MLGFLKNLFIKKENINMDSEQKEIRQATAPKLQTDTHNCIPGKFEIAVYQADCEKSDGNGNPITSWKRVNYEQPVYIEASSKKDLDELQEQYHMCDQKFEILRVIRPPQNPNNAEPKQPQQAINRESAPAIENKSMVSQTVSVQQHKPHSQVKPKIVTIGDIQVKYDGDKVYQKQWIKLTPTESANIRLINDSNNKVINLDGKHFEAKKWVLIEDDSDNGSFNDIIGD